MTRPKIKIKREPIDRIIEAVGMAAVVVMISLPLVYYRTLPEMIPSHYGAGGEPDAYSEKVTIWILPAVGLVMYGGLYILNKYPHIFNYLTEINDENARVQYKLATRMVRILNSVIVCAFCYITYTGIQAAMGNQVGLGKHFLLIIMTGVFGPIAIYLYQALMAARS